MIDVEADQIEVVACKVLGCGCDDDRGRSYLIRLRVDRKREVVVGDVIAAVAQIGEVRVTDSPCTRTRRSDARRGAAGRDQCKGEK